ncbi:hypothetical protein ANN_24410 [Periplaneta americana]|uniref:Reverse transcriptase domain-containing protein n=1 Tax=Periplaneta americana TaxID=6978 RepID=A0ABQ8S3G8_PERAM|nr:hypothetical protein ANN_24410 [Periplaneta americana]
MVALLYESSKLHRDLNPEYGNNDDDRFDLVPHDILIDKLSRLGIDKRVVLWIQEFLKGRTQRVRVGHEISEIGNISSGVPQGSVLGPLLFIIYVNDLCQDITSNVRLFADDCIIYRKIRNNSDVDAIQTDLNNIFNWALKHRMKINGSKSKSITFCKTREETSLNYEFNGVVIPQEQCCKYLGVYLNSKLSWGEHVDNVTGKAWRALHFIMKILRKASPKSREIAYLTLVRPLMEYGTTCWDPYRIYQINSLERIQYRAAKFVKGKREDGNDTIKELKWETLENRRRKTRITSMYRAHLGQKAWVDITARLEKPTYYGRNDHDFKIKCRKQKTNVGSSLFLTRHKDFFRFSRSAAGLKFPIQLLEVLYEEFVQERSILKEKTQHLLSFGELFVDTFPEAASSFGNETTFVRDKHISNNEEPANTTDNSESVGASAITAGDNIQPTTIVSAFRTDGSRSSNGLHFPRVLTPILNHSPQLKSAGTAWITSASVHSSVQFSGSCVTSGRQHALKWVKGKRSSPVCPYVQQEEVGSITVSSYECTIMQGVLRGTSLKTPLVAEVITMMSMTTTMTTRMMTTKLKTNDDYSNDDDGCDNDDDDCL